MYFLIDKTSVFSLSNRRLQKTKAGKATLSDPTAVFLFLSADEAELIKYFCLLRNTTNSPMGLISCRFLLSKRSVVFLRNEKDLRGVPSFLKTLVLFQKTGEERRAVLFPPRSV